MKKQGESWFELVIDKGLSSNVLSLLLIVLSAIFVRLPYFSQLTVNWDETTFIIMGQDILNGNLPYTNLWDLKPPVGFAIFSFFVSLAGDSIVVIRTLGTFYLGFAAFFVYLSLKTVTRRSFAFLGALLFIILISTLTLQQSIYTEHLLLLPLTICLWIFSFERIKTIQYLYVGALIALACFIRLNLVFIAPALCLYVLLSPALSGWKEKFIAAIFISLGFWVVVLLIALPYVLTGEFAVFWRSVFMGSLSYSNTEFSMLQTLIAQVGNLFKHNYTFSITYSFLNAFLYLPALWGMWVFFKSYKSINQTNRRFLEVSLLFLAAAEFSILIGGRMNDHYIIQLTPMLVTFFAYGVFNLYQAIGNSLTLKPKRELILIATFMVCLFYLPQNYALFSQGNELVKPMGELCTAEYLTPRLRTEDKLYVLTGHIIYWLVGKDPIRPSVTHPSTITRPYLFPFIPGAEDSAEKELVAIMDEKPAYIVKEEFTWYFDDIIGLQQIFDEKLAENYSMAKQCDSYFVYQRNDLE